MVDYNSFATAFLQGTAKNINERKDKTEDYEDRQRELAEKNKGIITKRKQIVGQALGLAKQAEGLFATPEMVSAALDSGPGGLQNLVAQLTQGKAAQGKRWNAEAAKTIATLPEGYKVPEGDLQSRIASTYGLPQASLGSTAAPERSWWDRATGKGGKAAVRAELDTESFVDGYSIMDVNEAASQSEYQSLTGGTFVNYAMPKMFDSDDLATEVSTLEVMMDRAKGTKAYADAAAVLAQREAVTRPVDKNERVIYDAGIAEAKASMVAAQRSFLADFVKNRAASFTGGNYFDAMGNTIAAYLGEDFVSSMDITNPSVAPVGVNTGEEPVTKDLSQTATDVEDAGGKVEVTTTGTTMSHVDIPGGSITLTKVDADGQPEVGMITIDNIEYELTGEALTSTMTEINNIKPISAGRELSLENINTDLAAMSPDEIPTLDPALTTKEERDGMSKSQLKAAGLKYSPLGKLLQHLPDNEERERRATALVLKREADPEKWYKMVVPGLNLNRPFKVLGKDLFYIPDVQLARYDKVKISEFGIDEELPRRSRSGTQIQGYFNTKNADKGVAIEAVETEEAITADGSVRPNKRPEGLMKEPEVEQTIAEIESEYVIKNYGREILQYLRDQGYSSEDTEENIAEGLQGWYRENESRLPADAAPLDRGPITYVLKAALG
jgi:hypothetical protein